MRHLLLLSALLLPGGAGAAERPRPPAAQPGADPVTGRPCTRPGVRFAQSGDEVRADKLGELPPGDLLLTVVREVEGCRTPVIVRYGYGGAAPAPRQRREQGFPAPRVRPRPF